MKKILVIMTLAVIASLVSCRTVQKREYNYVYRNALFNMDTNAVVPLQKALFNVEKCQATPWPGLLANGHILVKAVCQNTEDIKRFDKVQLLTRSLFVTETMAKDAAIAYYRYIQENAGKPVAKYPTVLEQNVLTAHVTGGYVTHARFDKDYNCELVYSVPVRGINISGKDHSQLTKDAQELLVKQFGNNDVPEYEPRFFYSLILKNKILVKAFAPAPDHTSSPLNKKRYSKEAAEINAQQKLIVLQQGEKLKFEIGRFSSEASGSLSGVNIADTQWDDQQNCQVILEMDKK